MAMPPEAVVHVQLLDMSVWDVPPPVIAEVKFPLGSRQVPVPFELKVDPLRIDFRHSYALRARIVVGDEIRFLSELPTAVRLRDNASPHVELVLMQMER
jgi:putative lipoprotein